MSNHQEMEITFFGSDPNRSGIQGWTVHSLTIDFGVDPEHLERVASFIIRAARVAVEGGLPAAASYLSRLGDMPELSDSVRDAVMGQAFEAASDITAHQRCGWTDFTCFTKLRGSALPGSSDMEERQFMRGHRVFAGARV